MEGQHNGDQRQDAVQSDLFPSRPFFTLGLDLHLDPMFRSLSVFVVGPDERLGLLVDGPRPVGCLDVEGPV